MSNNMKDRKVLVVGLGKSGIAAVKAMVELGAYVSVQDSKAEKDVDEKLLGYLKDNNVKCYFGFIPEDMGAFDMLIVSPGVSPELPFVQEAALKGAEIVGELEIAYREGNGK
ncbi:MAG: UDP-N-acetylmuramoyl-L-alanine--D-glutamate ligase, partial [Firmicutes bacterium]|nr:UDP-N-acetylmuramoyl-L-alanine--D-glutamate ligase [Bacillota bacterium]